MILNGSAMLKNKLKSTVSLFVLLSYVSILSPGYALEDDSSSDDDRSSSSSSPQKRSRAEITPSPRSPSSTPSCSSSHLPTSSETASSAEDFAKRQRGSPTVESSLVEDDLQLTEQELTDCESAWKKGCAASAYKLSKYWKSKNNSKQQRKYLEEAADFGHPVALFEMAESFYQSIPKQRRYELTKMDREPLDKALDLYKRVIADDSLAVQTLLGWRYKKSLERTISIFVGELYRAEAYEIGDLAQVFDAAFPYIVRGVDIGYWKAFHTLGYYSSLHTYQEQENEVKAENALLRREKWFEKCFNAAHSLEKESREKAIDIYEFMHREGYYIRAISRLWQLSMEAKEFSKAKEYARVALYYSGEEDIEKILVSGNMCLRSQPNDDLLDQVSTRYYMIANISPEAGFNAGWIFQHNPRLLRSNPAHNPVPLYRAAANRGNKEAQFMMGSIMKRFQNNEVALARFKEAASQHHLGAQFALAEMFLKGQGIQQSDEQQAFEWFQKGYQNESFKEHWRMLYQLSEPQNEIQAFQLFKDRVYEGSIEMILANTYASLGDFQQYISFLSLASEKRRVLPNFTLARHYETGADGIASDLKQAIRLYLQAGTRGLAPIYRIGTVYRNGQGIERSFTEAFNAFRSAALCGHLESIQRQQQLFCFLTPEAGRASYEDDAFNPEKHNISAIISLFHQSGHKEAMTAYWKSLLNSHNREDIRDICLFIMENYKALGIAENNELFLEVMFKLAQDYEMGNDDLDFNSAIFRLYFRAGKLGYPPAIDKVGAVYRNCSFSNAFDWFRSGSLSGYQQAAFMQKQLFHFLIPETLRGAYEDASFNPQKHDIPGVISLYRQSGHKEAMKAHWNALLNSPNREVVRDISFFIQENSEALGIKENSELFLKILSKETDKTPHPAQAFRRYLEEARQGNLEAMYIVAEAYKNGHGVQKHFASAFKVFRAAALRGHQEALCKQQQLFHFLIPEALRVAHGGDYFDPRKHDIPMLISLYRRTDSQQMIMNYWDTLLNSPDREEMRDISSFILENYKTLGISEESDLFLEVVGKKALSEDITDPKNPFIVWPALLQKRAVPVDVSSLVPEAPFWVAEDQHWRFNPARLEAFGQNVHIDPETVKPITAEHLIEDFAKIQAKLMMSPGLSHEIAEELLQPAQQDMGENPEDPQGPVQQNIDIEEPLDPVQRAIGEITKVSNGGVPLTFEQLKIYALGHNRNSFFLDTLFKDSVAAAQLKAALFYISSFSDEGGNPLSKREKQLIRFVMAVKACAIGQESGLTDYYQLYVPDDLKYEVTGDLFSHDPLPIQRSKHIFIRIMQEVVDSILNTDNSFMQRVCGVTGKVPQLSHQALYLKTLIGDKISVPFCRFDPSTNCLVDPLLTLAKEETLRHFYEYILKDETLVKEVKNKINQAVLTGNTYLQLKELTHQWTYMDDENATPSITREGVMELFIKVGLVEEAFPRPAVPSSSSS